MSETLKGEAIKASSLDQFLIILREHEIKTYSRFVCTRSDKAFTEEKFAPTKDLRIRWNENLPYFHIGRRLYSCHQGKDANLWKKKRYAEKRDSMACTDADITKRKKAQRTKKLGCPAVISVTRVLALPRFKIQNGSKLEKFDMIREITKKIEKGEELGGEIEYSFTLPGEESHQNHTVGSNAAVMENMDPKVRSKIKELVLQGVRNISVISATVEQFVANELGETDKSRRRFYPTRESIRNVVNSIKRKIMSGKLDLENADHSINSCAEKSDLSSNYFPPCTVKPSSDMIVQCNSIIKSLLSVMCQLDENYLIKLKNDLQNIYLDATLNITAGKNTLAMEERSLLSKGNLKKPSKPTPLNRKIKKKVKIIDHAADAKKNEILFLYTTSQENSTSSTPLYFISNADRLIDLPEIPIKEESIQYLAHTIEVSTSKSLSPQKKKLKTLKET